MLRADQQFGPYILIKPLGKGAYGVVWLAERRTAIATTLVAIKIPQGEEIDLNAIRQEAALWAIIGGHPNVLPMIEANIYEDQIVIVSEYAPDGSLANWLQQHDGHAPTIRTALTMTMGILSGLEHLHARKVLHRDLKPANILLQGETPRLADFGLSRILKTGAQSSQASGTPSYMSPESFDGRKLPQSDIWAVGVIFYQLLTGSLPFPAQDYSSLIGAIMIKPPVSLPQSIPTSLQQIILRALEKKPEQRYASVTEMKVALQNTIEKMPKELLSQTIKSTEQQRDLFDSLPQPGPITSSSEIIIDNYRPGLTTIPETEIATAHQSRAALLRKRPLLITLIVVVTISLIGAFTRFTNRRTANAPSITPSTKSQSTNKEPAAIVTNQQVNGPALQRYSFQQVLVDATGQITEARTGQANFFREDLGEGVSLEMTEIPGGSFVMGSPNSESYRSDNEGPQHQVQVNSFYLSKFEVSQRQWKVLMGVNPALQEGDDLPVDSITWDEASEFCRRLGRKSGRAYRLPTEAEWEYACRAGTTTPFAFGETLTMALANFEAGKPYGAAPIGISRHKSLPSGKYIKANAFGLYEVHGNLSEWCQDSWHDDYHNAPATGSAWQTGGDQTRRVYRGGSWNDYASACRSAARNKDTTNTRFNFVGFRVAVTITTK